MGCPNRKRVRYRRFAQDSAGRHGDAELIAFARGRTIIRAVSSSREPSIVIIAEWDDNEGGHILGERDVVRNRRRREKLASSYARGT